MNRALWIFGWALVVSFVIAGPTGSGKSEAAAQDKEILLKMTDDMTHAKMKRDVKVLDGLLADDCIFTNPAGLFADKAQYLDGARADTAVYESVTNSDQLLRIYGNAAVVAGSTTLKGRYDGQEIGGRFRFTKMFVKRHDKWQCVAIHLTRIAAQQ
jgi:ketosteroid isomerase-like protein